MIARGIEDVYARGANANCSRLVDGRGRALRSSAGRGGIQSGLLSLGGSIEQGGAPAAAAAATAAAAASAGATDDVHGSLFAPASPPVAALLADAPATLQLVRTQA